MKKDSISKRPVCERHQIEYSSSQQETSSSTEHKQVWESFFVCYFFSFSCSLASFAVFVTKCTLFNLSFSTANMQSLSLCLSFSFSLSVSLFIFVCLSVSLSLFLCLSFSLFFSLYLLFSFELRLVWLTVTVIHVIPTKMSVTTITWKPSWPCTRFHVPRAIHHYTRGFTVYTAGRARQRHLAAISLLFNLWLCW